MKKNVAWALLAALSLTACENDENDNWNGEIRLGSSVNTLGVTKAFGLDEQIKEGRTISLWVDDAKDPIAEVTKEELYQNNVLSVGASGDLTGGTTMFFPQTGNKVHLYAIHPSAATNEFPSSTPYSHEVKADQTTAENYAASDLLYAVKRNVGRTSDVIELPFNHVLSKVEVKLTAGTGSPSFDGATVTLEGLALKAEFTPAKDEDLTLSAITVPDEGDSPASIAIGNSSAEANEAIIIPQTWEADKDAKKAFIKIKLKDGGELSYVPEENIEFGSGKKYVYTITANLTGLTVSAKIEGWGEPVTMTGTATMQ